VNQNASRSWELEKDLLDLKITNRGKDYFIEQLQKERDRFDDERKDYVEKLIVSSRRVEELETRLQQLMSPKNVILDEGVSAEAI
jgi:hypothetical protein